MIRDLLNFNKKETTIGMILIRLVIGSGILFLCFFRYHLFPVISNVPTLDTALTVLVVLLCGPSIALIYLAVFSTVILLSRSDNSDRYVSENSVGSPREIAIRWIIHYCSMNDIVEILASVDDCPITLGKSSDFDKNSSCFKDTEYYINHEIFSSEAEFNNRLQEIAPSGKIMVHEIDGLTPTNNNFNFN